MKLDKSYIESTNLCEEVIINEDNFSIGEIRSQSRITIERI